MNTKNSAGLGDTIPINPRILPIEEPDNLDGPTDPLKEKGSRGVRRKFNRKHNRKNDQVSVVHRRAIVSKMYMEGMTMETISEHIGESVSTVSRDVAYLRNVWKQEAKRDFETKLGIELERLRQLDTMLLKQIELDGNVMRLKGGQFIKVGERASDPAYFDQLRKNIELRMKAMGAIAGNTLNINNNNGNTTNQPTIWDMLSGAINASQVDPTSGKLLPGPEIHPDDEEIKEAEYEEVDSIDTSDDVEDEDEYGAGDFDTPSIELEDED